MGGERDVVGWPMTDESEIKASSDAMLEMLQRLHDIETEKRQFPLGSEEFTARAAEAENLSRIIFRWSGIQQQMAEEAKLEAERGEGRQGPLEAAQVRPLDRILTGWRRAQIRLEVAAPGTAEAEAAAEEVARLRDEYQAAQDGRDDPVSEPEFP